jgi:hypothetical protein
VVPVNGNGLVRYAPEEYGWAASRERRLCRDGHCHHAVANPIEQRWQSGYYDHVLRQEEDRLRVTAYLLGNPIRAGLVTRIGDYPFWGSAVWSRDDLIEAVQDLGSVSARFSVRDDPRRLKPARYDQSFIGPRSVERTL